MQGSCTLGTTGLTCPVRRIRASLGVHSQLQHPSIHTVSLKAHRQRNVRIQAQGEGV